ncbi:MAG: aminotransferase class V-fold PLP-dependent enzyme [Deltaproteobacteria bacterium]|nr:aminotransferase class V-fold PLP-dependent enzyme [Deltaproteobacteria bacterium]
MSGRPHDRRLLLGPGPSNVHPRVLRAMAQPLYGHLDPAFLTILDEVQSGLRELFGSVNPLTLPLSATGSAGMEACLCNLLEPGDEIVVGVAGVFGARMSEVAERIGARVTRVESEPGAILSEDEMIDAIRRVRPRAVAFVHAETSTGVCQPVPNLAHAAHEVGALVVLDCVTSLAGLPLELDRWGIDAAYSGTQKCLSCPPGLSPVSFSERAVERAASRKAKVQSWYLDINLLAGYFGGERVYHHTAPISAIFGLAEGLRIVAEEGMQDRTQRHFAAAAALVEGLREFGMEPLVAPEHRLPMLTAVRLPKMLRGAEEAKLRHRLLDHWGIEVGAGLGTLAGEIWRIGLMGENARLTNVESLLCALRRELG